MRDNIRKPGARHPAVVLLTAALLATGCGPAGAATRTEHGPCTVSHGTLGETDQPTPEISTEQMEVEVARDTERPLIVDARPHAEFAIGHIPGAVNVSDVGGIGTLLHGNVDTPIVVYCNGPFCAKSKGLATALRNAGYTHVVRYQLGIPVWRALGHPTQTEPSALDTFETDPTAVVIDARDRTAFGGGSLRGARNVRFDEVEKAQEDGRLPMMDHNTRILVVGVNGVQARTVAQEIARNAFQNVSYYAGSVDSLMRDRPKEGGR